MNINELTIGQARELASMFQTQTKSHDHPYEIGSVYLIRTVTMINTGKLVAVFPQELVIEDAAWIPDTGRFHDALKSGCFSEVEPFPNGKVIIGRGSIIDMVKIESSPRIQK